MPRITSPVILFAAGTMLLAACTEIPKSPPARRSMSVQVVSAQYLTVPASIEAPGSVQPRTRITLSSQINGSVLGVNAQAGDMVSGGQTLVTLDARDARSQKDMAQAAIEEARTALEEARKGAQVNVYMSKAAKANAELAAATCRRFQQLFAAQSVSPQELDEATARRDAAAADLAGKETLVAAAQDRLKQLEARIAQANAQSQRADVLLGWTVIKSPVNARVMARQAEPGSAIFPGSPLLVLESSANPQVVANLPAVQLSLLRIGLEVDVQISDAGSLIRGRVAEIVPISSSTTHTIQFKVDLPSGAGAPTGSYARVQVPTGSRNALLVPITAVRETGQLTGLFVVDSGAKARFRLVKTAPFDAGHLEVLSGVEPGERVVVTLSDELNDGSPLEVRS